MVFTDLTFNIDTCDIYTEDRYDSKSRKIGTVLATILYIENERGDQQERVFYNSLN